jgi:hypothetical protein
MRAREHRGASLFEVMGVGDTGEEVKDSQRVKVTMQDPKTPLPFFKSRIARILGKGKRAFAHRRMHLIHQAARPFKSRNLIPLRPVQGSRVLLHVKGEGSADRSPRPSLIFVADSRSQIEEAPPPRAPCEEGTMMMMIAAF